jgi:5-methylcytosine-specific restriction endonuclease McrA
MQKTAAVCPQCGKEFWYYPSAYRNKPKTHCSKQCWSAAAWLHKVCSICGKEFTCRQCEPTEHCSRACARRARAENRRVSFACAQCGQQVTRGLSNYQGKGQSVHVCSTACWGAWLKQHPQQHITARRTRLDRTCRVCGIHFHILPSEAIIKGYGSCCGRKCADIWRKMHPGPNKPPVRYGPQNGNWKGGYKKYYGPSWKVARSTARKRDNYACQHCGKTEIGLGRELDVHHIRPFREFGLSHHREANQISNLVSLCDHCHKAVEPRGCIV